MGFELDIESDERLVPDVTIKVVGVGGGGGNALNCMVASEYKEVDYIAVNTDAAVLNTSKAGRTVQIGQKLTRGRGAGNKPEIGERSAQENRDEIAKELEGAQMVFIAAGMGGGTGTGAAPVVAEIAQELDILTVAVVTKPFRFEQAAKMRQAEKGIEELSKHVDALIVIPNERLLVGGDKPMTMKESFARSDEVLMTGVQSIADLILRDGFINLDFADVQTTMKNAGIAHMAIGHGSGKDKAKEAVEQVISSPLLETSIKGARRLLVNIVMSEDALSEDINQFADLISSEADDEVEVVFGADFDPEMKDEMHVTVIATNFIDGQITGSVTKNDTTGGEAKPAADANAKIKSIDNDYSSFFELFNDK